MRHVRTKVNCAGSGRAKYGKAPGNNSFGIRKGHGPLGAIYPRSGFYPDNPGMQEGDTPSFMYLVSAVHGMHDPENPNQESWGGQYERRDSSTNHCFDGPGAQSVAKWLPEIQEDFANRADLMLP